ncbi:MAG: NADH-quinone oxidoreductase subunit H [Asgard group archaeon]|nr:NADH-quinone oxidoreductase subunit H [Asgard group archaeon]
MAINWMSLIVFPGLLFILVLNFLTYNFSHLLNNLIWSTQLSNKTHFLVPMASYYTLLRNKVKHKDKSKKLLQICCLLGALFFSLLAALFIPIGLLGVLPECCPFSSNLVLGVLTFNGDFLVFFALMFSSNLLLFFCILLNQKISLYTSLKIFLPYILLDLPILLCLVPFIISLKTLSISILVENVQYFVYFNPFFTFFFLLPCSLLIGLFSIVIKFDHPYFLPPKKEKRFLQNPPISNDWLRVLWDIAIHLQEFLYITIIVTILLGGPHFPIPDLSWNPIFFYALNFSFKVFVLYLVILIIRSLIPRTPSFLKENITWKILTPTALLQILIVAIIII